MLFIVAMSIMVSLADLFGPEAKPIELDSNQITPTYKAILTALLFPLVATAFTIKIKYIKILKISTEDWLFAYNLSWGFVFCLIAIAYWWINPENFELKFLVIGSVSGICTIIGCLLATYALRVDGAPQGPTCALFNSRIIFLVIIDAVVMQVSPPLIQWLGLLAGVFGTLILAIPDELSYLLKKIFGVQAKVRRSLRASCVSIH